MLAWLAKASYYGDPYTPESIRERVGGDATIGDWVHGLTTPAAFGLVMPSSVGYDDKTQTWTAAVLDFSENYDDYIAAVAVFREIAKYKDLPGDDGLLIYGFLFENEAVAVALRIEMGASHFLAESATESLVSEANAAMTTLTAEGAASYER